MNDRSRWIALVVLCTGMLMIVLDMTIVNVALPSIQADLGFSQAGLAWVVNAYLIAFAGLLLLAGRLGDLAGRRNVFLTGLAVFTVASLACGLAVNQGMLIAVALTEGYHLAFWIAFGLVVAAIAAAAALLRPQRAAAAEPQQALELVRVTQAELTA